MRVSSLTTDQVRRVARERLISTATICSILEIRRQSLLERVEADKFPKPIAQFGGAFVWDIAEVQPFLPK